MPTKNRSASSPPSTWIPKDDCHAAYRPDRSGTCDTGWLCPETESACHADRPAPDRQRPAQPGSAWASLAHSAARVGTEEPGDLRACRVLFPVSAAPGNPGAGPDCPRGAGAAARPEPGAESADHR